LLTGRDRSSFCSGSKKLEKGNFRGGEKKEERAFGKGVLLNYTIGGKKE